LEEEKRSLEEELKEKKNELALQLASSGDQHKVGGPSHWIRVEYITYH